MRALRISLKVVGWLILSVLLLVSSVLLTAVILGRTDWGHRKLLGVALPQIRKQLVGDLHIGRLDGNLTRGLTLHDVVVTDKEHRPAVRVHALTVHYNLLGLLHHTIDLTSLEAEGAWVHARVMRDGKMNLAELTKPSQAKPADPNAKPYRIRVGKVAADLEAIYDPPPAPDAKRVHAAVKLEARADVNGGDIDVGIGSFEAHTFAPLVALASLKGELHDADGALSAKHLDLVVSAEGRELRRLAPTVNLRGRWSVALRADGPADKLLVSLAARPPAGKLDVEAELRSRAGKPGQPAPSVDALGWKATVTARGIDPAAAVAGVPHGTVRIDARGEGHGATGAIDLRGLEAAVAGATVKAHGRFNTDGDVKAVASVDAPDLSKLRALGVKDIAGQLALTARIDRARHELDVDADANGKQLSFGKNHVGALALHVRSEDFLGTASLQASKIRTPEVVLDTLTLSADGNPKSVKAQLAARGPNKTAVDIALHGKPDVVRDRDGLRVEGADLTIDRFSVARYDQTLAAQKPATLNIHRVIELAGLVLASGNQTLALDGKFDRKTEALQASFKARSLDINKLVRFAKPSQDLPTTSLDLTVAAHGTTKAPVADLAISGWSERKKLVINRIHYNAKLHYGEERVRGQLAITAIDEFVKGKLDVPVVFTGDRKLSVELQVNNLVTTKLRKVLPPSLAALQGRIDMHLALDGTTLRPKLDLDAHGRSLALGDETNNDVTVKVKYAERHLSANAGVTLAKTAAGNAGALDLSVNVPITLSAPALQQKARLVEEVMHKTPIDALVTIKKLDLAHVPFAEVGVAPPVTGGIVDGSIKLRGTMHQPLFDADLAAHGLKKGKLDKLDVTADVDYKDKRATAKLAVRLRDAALLDVKGEAPIDVERVVDGKPWKQTPVVVDAEVPRYPLARLKDLVPQLDGALEVKAAVRGTVAHPTGKLDLAIAALQLGAMKYDHFLVKGGFDGQKVTAHLDAREQKGGTLGADATLPVDAAQALQASLRAKGFYIDVENVDLTNPRLVKGTLDASVDVNGPRANPTITGALHFSDGKLALASDPRIYDRIKLDVQVGNGNVVLQDLEAHLQDGSLKANGQVTLAGLTPRTVLLKAYARKFPVEPGTFGMWVDADVTVQGKGDANGMSGSITVDKGTANLPKLAGGKKLQSTAPLKDVRFVDPEALAAEKKRKEAEKSAPTTELTASIPGPFHVRSKEISADLKGRLKVAVAGPVVRVSGHVEEMSTGWIELLGRRYDIEKANVALGGEVDPDPELDIRLTRQLSQAMIVIEVHGTASKPQLQLTSDPPIYDQSQVIMAILAGSDPAQGDNRQDETLDNKVTGAVSSLIVGKIKDQIAPNLPIDVLKVDTGATGTSAGGLGDTRIEVGKFITPSVYVSYVHQFGNTMVGTQHFNSNEADVNWRFYRNYELDTSFGDAAVGHVNVFWTIRY